MDLGYRRGETKSGQISLVELILGTLINEERHKCEVEGVIWSLGWFLREAVIRWNPKQEGRGLPAYLSALIYFWPLGPVLKYDGT